MNNKIIVFGSSGHARSISVILERLDYEIVGFIDSYLPKGEKVLNYRVIGDETILKNCIHEFEVNKVVVGVGDINSRIKVVNLINEINPNIEFPTIVSPDSSVANYTKIGQGTVVFSNTFINVETKVGDFCVVNSGSIVEHNTIIGDYCTISPGANLGGDVDIKANTFIGSSATIIQKKKIGKNVVIGAGAVVTKDLPNNVLAVGIPAVIKKENYFNKNIFS